MTDDPNDLDQLLGACVVLVPYEGTVLDQPFDMVGERKVFV